MRMLKGPNKLVKNICGVDVDQALGIRGKKGYGVSVAVLDGEGDLLTYCSGSGRCGEDFPVNPDMLFQAGSVSKPLFALTLLRYADKGLIDLDADLSGIVPEFVKKGPVTFAALLSHTAGYNVHGFPGYRADHEPLTLEDVLSGRGNTPKLRRIKPCGKQFLYSGGGITLAELAFTRITGVTLREAFQKEVAEPLGLQRTGYFQPLDEDLAKPSVSNTPMGPFQTTVPAFSISAARSSRVFSPISALSRSSGTALAGQVIYSALGAISFTAMVSTFSRSLTPLASAFAIISFT